MMREGWVPFDEGTLAQSAHRILIGQMPHRDFDEVYTGGLSFAYAAAFHVLGQNLATLRFVLFACILVVLPVYYYIASRFAPTILAAGLSMAAFLTSFPSYPAGMPSWYNLIFALLGCASFLRYLEVGTKRWLVAAGLCGGLSILVKIVGVYFVAGGVLFLIFHSFASSPGSSVGRQWRPGAAFVLAILTVAAIGPFAIMHARFRAAEVVELGLPVVAMCISVAVQVWRTSERFGAIMPLRKLRTVAWPFAIGVLVPIVCLIAIYARADALPALFRGVFILPQRRLEWTAVDGPPVAGLLLGLPPLLLLTSARFSVRELRWYDALLIATLEFAIVMWSAYNLKVTESLWTSIRMAAPLAIIASAIVLALPNTDNRGSPLQQQGLLLLGSVAAWCALVQFPVDTYQYFLYVLPLFLLSGGALAAIRGTPSRPMALTTLGALVILGVLLRPVFVAGGGSHVVLVNGQARAVLDVDRGGLTVRRNERDDYVRVLEAIHQHSRSSFIYVSPDAPEIYFLSNRENPTRTLFDFFDDQNDRTNRILAAIRAHQVDVVVINKRPRFSGDMSISLRDSLQSWFSETAEIGPFEVRWRL